jgi:hypothetical protein
MGDSVESAAADVDVSLTKLFGVCAASDPVALYQSSIRNWATTYLTMPHPELGREGPVCPFSATSIKKEAFWVGCVDKPRLTSEDVESTVAGLVPQFHQLPPENGAGALLKTILVLFPGVADYRLIDYAQSCLKDKSVAMGLMIGQFYPGCEEPGIRNAQFKPLQSPVPLLAIRHMVASDFPFLTSKTKWKEQYLKRFSPPIPAQCIV